MALDPPGEVVLIAHELSTGWFHNIDADARARLLEADRFLAVSRCVERFLIEDLGVAPDRISSAPPMVEAVESHVPAHRDEATGPFVVAGGGMTDWRKAPELWLNVAFQVRRAAPDLRVSWVWFGGDPPSSREFWPIAHEIEHLGLAAQVAFLGDVSDTASVLSSCDLFLSTAREDAYPLVCAEAAMSGVPVIAFDGGGAAELVDDGRCGRTVSYPDLGRMAAEVVDLLRHPQRRRELGESGRAFARSHLDVSVVGPAISEWILPQAAP
jgi:glycosyltransferase involved in cell wall biosynthesis